MGVMRLIEGLSFDASCDFWCAQDKKNITVLILFFFFLLATTIHTAFSIPSPLSCRVLQFYILTT